MPTPPLPNVAAHASLGPFIGVVIMVLILTAAAVVIGRICSGRSIMGYGDYNMERWVEARFPSCVGGSVLAFSPAVAGSTLSGSGDREEDSAPASASTREQQA